MMRIPATPGAARAPRRPSDLGAPAAIPQAQGVDAVGSYTYLTPDLAAPITEVGVPLAGLIPRTVPGMDGVIWTPPDTYLLVDPDGGIYNPKLTWQPYREGLVTLGFYGNSVLLGPEGMDLKKLPDAVFEAVVGAKKPPPGQLPTQYINAEGFLIQKPPPALVWNGGFAPTLTPGGGSATNKPGFGFPASGFDPKPPQSGSSDDIEPTGCYPCPDGVMTCNGNCAGHDKKDEATPASNTALVILGLGVLGLGIYAVTRR